MPSVDGEWTLAYSGGLPPAETWASNPQFAIQPTVDGATYAIELVRHDVSGQARCGLWVMKADGVVPARKAEFTGMMEKSKVSTSERRSLELKLPLRKNSLPYIAMVALQEPGALGRFTLTVTSIEDEGVTLTPLQDAPGASTAAASASAGAGDSAAASASAIDSSAAPTPLSSFNPAQGGSGAAPPALSKAGASFSFGKDAPSNVPVLEVLGQGLSKKLQQDAAAAVAEAEAAAAAAADGLYVDVSFPADETSLGAEASSLGVVSWRRLGEIEPPDAMPRGGDGSLLAHAEGCGLKVGTLKDEWLLGALNVVGGNVDVLERTFVDTAHAAQGFYAVRLYAEDPASDDDWQVVLIDDRIPCAADGLPAFGRGARAGGLWAALVEKAAAKRFGSYATLQGDGGGEATLRGLELVTGGKARELSIPDKSAPKAELASAWNGIKEALGTDQVVCARCDLGSSIEASAAEMGIVPGRTYCVIVANDLMGGGQQLMRMRGFVGDAEWNGAWSDHSDKWTSRLRQLLAYSKDDTDGTFWIAYDDFVKYFTSAYAARVADDRWTKFTVKSRWMDETAGGPPDYSSWRDNYQWLLALPRETTMTFSLSLPDARLSAPNLLALPPIGLMVVKGNGGPHARRRKLRLTAQDEVVFSAEPRAARSLQVTATLPASPEGEPYVLVPYTMSPGVESPFTLRILLDDLDDDGNPDIVFEPCLPNPPNREDWSCKRLQAPWVRAAGAPSTPQFVKNDRLSFTLMSPSASEGTVRICVETIGVATDMRLEDGMQSSPQFPPIGLALFPNAEAASLAAGGALPANAQLVGPLPTDAVWLEATLPVGGTPHVVVPYLGQGATPLGKLQFALSVYSDLPLGEPEPPAPPPAGVAAPPPPETNDDGAWACELCDGPDAHGPVCPYRLVIQKMSRMEALMDERCRFLDERLSAVR